MTSRFATLTRRLLGLENSPGGTATDRQLLERFVRDRDQVAFAAVLERHGPMVHAVCRRVLGRSADADDAFQATFLVLVRRVASVGWHDSLGGWLHAVAYRVARKARSNAARAADRVRRAAPQKVPTMPDADPPTAVAHRELCTALDAELAELPEKYRLPLVLCYLEGRTNEEVALQLGWTKGTVSGRLARARDLLRGRLARRGLAPSVAAIEVALSDMASAAPLPAPLFESTLRAAALSASGSAAVAGAVSARAYALTEGVSRAMSLTRLKVTTAALLAFCLLGTGATLLAYHALAADQKEMKGEEEPAPKPADKPPAKPMTDDEKLQGTWTITNADSLQKGTQWTFNGGRLEGYGQPNKEGSTRYKLDPEQNPKSIDLTAQAGNDGPILFQVNGIYQLAGDELKVCFAPGKEDRPKAFPAGGVGSVLILKREPAPVSDGDKLADGVYLLTFEGTGRRVKLTDGSDAILGKRLSTSVGVVGTLRSHANDNTRFTVTINNLGPLPPEVADVQTALVVDGLVFHLGRPEKLPADRVVNTWANVYSAHAARALAARYKVEPAVRKHPGHRFEVRWQPAKVQYEVGEAVKLTMEIKNTGAGLLRFTVGGQQRGPRDNQYRFVAQAGVAGKGLPDVGDARNHGGISTSKTLRPGEAFTAEVDLSKWFAFAEPDTYRITGVFEMPIVDAASKDGFDPIVWDDLAVGDCAVRVVAKKQ